MYHEIEEQDILIPDFELKVFDKEKGKVILKRYIVHKDTSESLFDEQVNIYHNMDKRVIITLYDLEKCTNIRHYDTDDNI